ncbi:acyl carrier protein [Actinoplanes derwentensis]|uniref:Phosphopantetheine attachment site n=1 Tax=Actinoplanes derwentensis TaxID=113562 RepID=A0A1H1RA18_9ACTN|nr:phosphopantetheine-binding protein [Actinoplanes derwentensis]GID88054.1 hypothetical protein Ade03nite_69780 [Actinoplanes derwentensis]SDS32543.1 Phosphopantetheine attachment site [Actinoplanes derwentensis]
MNNIATIRQFVIEEFLPDVPADQLTDDLDLMESGVVDSLGVLKLIAWVEDRFELVVDDTALDPDNFRSVDAIDAFIARSGVPAAGGR